MSAGMNMEEAKKIAENMTFTQAIHNCLNAKCVPYRKATKIKIKELLDLVNSDDFKAFKNGQKILVDKDDFTTDLLNQGYTKGLKDAANKIDMDKRIKRIKDKSENMDLTYYKDVDGNYCICDINWIGRFKTISELEEYLCIEE